MELRSGFLSVLIAAVLTVWMLAGAGAYLLSKILNNLNERDEPEVLAISEEIESVSEELDNFSDDLDLNIEQVSTNKIQSVNKEPVNVNAVKAENKNNLKNKKVRAKSKKVKKANKINLNSFKVKAIKADEDDFMPEDTSKSLNDLKLELNKKKASKKFDGGKGLIGDIYRGAKKIVEGADKATLDTSRRVIGSAVDVDIDKARLRPSGGGVKLHLDIAPKSKK
ncbi:MAG: hypothetical protein IJ520_04975 [Synergistaceae bacterium]|nr:hypothetical protein [Synergistaceae bacterium]